MVNTTGGEANKNAGTQDSEDNAADDTQAGIASAAADVRSTAIDLHGCLCISNHYKRPISTPEEFVEYEYPLHFQPPIPDDDFDFNGGVPNLEDHYWRIRATRAKEY
jgi:hypothetical protein